MASNKELRGRGWEKAVQHKVFKRFLKDEGWKYEFEVPLELTEFGVEGPNKKVAKVYVDFLIDKGSHYEVVVCKEGNHPTSELAAALGQALVYRSLLWKQAPYRDADIRLGLCLIDGYPGKYGLWSPAHDALLRELRKDCGGIELYLIGPVSPEFRTEEHWDDFEKQKIVWRTRPAGPGGPK